MITEGRRRFLRAYDELEEKAACPTFAADLAELARGTAASETVLALRPHLRHCPACRATLRELRGGRRRVAAWLPLPVAVWLAGRRGGAGDRMLDAETNAVEAGADPSALVSSSRWAEVKFQFHNLLQRFTGSDVATSVQIASTSGGGRAGGIAALIGFCISGVGAGTYCVATLVLPAEPPKPIVRKAEERPKRTERRSAITSTSDRPVELVTARQPVVVASPTPAPARRKRRTSRSLSSSGAGVGDGATSQEAPPPPVPAPQGQQEFSFESSAPAGRAGTSGAAPAAAPATGGGEFAP